MKLLKVNSSILILLFIASSLTAQVYQEKYRPQIHFSAQKGWINDPNGLIFYEGEYHLFYQHNPNHRDWGNMHWGHAVSADMIHWKELPLALFPDEHGTMFSGCALIDYDNTAGFNKGNTPAMIAVYTADSEEKQVQCMAYSLDKGRTWTKYKGNPLIDSKAKWNSKDTRDPQVFWYAPNKEWVMVLNERDGHSIYTSPDLKAWQYESHTTGFWECPQLFELPVDGNPAYTKWVMYGASGTYMIGRFNGKVFTPESGKYYYTAGGLYAAQTFANIPASDGRRIQIAWGRIETPKEMPFNNLMLIPTEFTLQTTKDGIRLFSRPVKEIDQLQEKGAQWQSLTAQQATDNLKPYAKSDALRIKTTLKLSHATDAGLKLAGQNVLVYDLNGNQVNGVFYSPQQLGSMEVTADIFIDRTCFEVFIDGGAYSFSTARDLKTTNTDGFQFFGHNIEVLNLEVYPLQSIWK
jgi:fructan beta-fructosidase